MFFLKNEIFTAAMEKKTQTKQKNKAKTKQKSLKFLTNKQKDKKHWRMWIVNQVKKDTAVC